jgi:hypothetical protein
LDIAGSQVLLKLIDALRRFAFPTRLVGSILSAGE